MRNRNPLRRKRGLEKMDSWGLREPCSKGAIVSRKMTGDKGEGSKGCSTAYPRRLGCYGRSGNPGANGSWERAEKGKTKRKNQRGARRNITNKAGLWTPGTNLNRRKTVKFLSQQRSQNESFCLDTSMTKDRGTEDSQIPPQC